MSESLPNGWHQLTAGELADIKSGITLGKRYPADTALVERPYLRVANVQRGHLDLREIKRVRVTAEEAARLTLEPGDVLMNEGGDRDKLGRGWIWNGEIADCIHQNHVFRLRPRQGLILPVFFSLYANHAGQVYFENEGKQTTNLASISQRKLAAFPVPVPPLAEQRRIVARIEALFDAIRDARKDLDRTLVLAERFRNTLVAAAISGELTSDRSGSGTSAEESGVFMDRLASERRQLWEQSELARAAAKGRRLKDNWKDRFPSPVRPVEHYVDSLPAGWTLASLDQLAWAASYGTSEKCDPAASGSPVLRIPNVAQGTIDLSDLKFATGDLGLVPGEAVAPGDLLIVRTNGSPDLVGRGAIVRQPLERDVYFASYLIRFRLTGNDTLWRWIALVWHSHMVRDQVFAKAASSAGQYNVSMTELASFALPIPPEAEQVLLVNLVEARLKVADEMERQARASHDLLSRLERQILDAAFRGDLVPQDAADEPAEETLARLRQEAEAPVSPGGRQRRRAA